MLLAEHRSRRQGLADLLPWAALIAPGIVANRQGTFTASWVYRAPDLASSTREELLATAHAVNRTFLPLQDEWFFHFDSIRAPAQAYAEVGAFPDAVTQLIDDERREQYETGGEHFTSRSVLSATWFPPTERGRRVARWFSTQPQEEPVHWDREVERFEDSLGRIAAGLGAVFQVERLGSAELLRHLHRCLTGKDHPIEVPQVPCYLDAVLASADLSGGFDPRVGRKATRVLAIEGLPQRSFPGVSDFLNELPVAYRWSSRWMPMSRPVAEAEIRGLRRNWFHSRLGLQKRLRAEESTTERDRSDVEAFANQDAVAMYRDANRALAEASSGLVAYGYYSNTIVLQDDDPAFLAEAARDVEKAVERQGFAVRLEETNAVDAFLGTLPGNYTDHVVRPLIHTLNLAHLIPLTSVFSGLDHNPSPRFPAASPPLFWATSGSTPYRGNLHVGDVGHALVIGPTGSGKSVLLGLLAASFFRYRQAQVFLFDRKYSALPLCKAARGSHYDLLADTEAPSFQPLAALDVDSERVWAASWLVGLYETQEVELEPRHQDTIHRALLHLSQAPLPHRTLTNLSVVLQSRRLREALKPYTLGGPWGHILDADRDAFTDACFHVFELRRLMSGAAAALVAPTVAYLFHRIETLLTGRPSLILVDEAWAFLLEGVYRRQIRSWVKEARKLNAAIVLATHSIEDIDPVRRAQGLFESLPTRVFLPNPEALSPRGSRAYAELGLNQRQIELIGRATPKRDYYWLSPSGRRLIDLELGPVALSFLGATDAESLDRIGDLVSLHGRDWPAVWLRERDLEPWAERLIRPQPNEVSS